MSSKFEDTLTLSSESISSFLSVSNILAGIAVIFGLLSVLVIFRYANKSMSDYKYHLLNTALTIFSCDICIQWFCQPYLLYPVMGVCMVGVLEAPLIKTFGVDGGMYAISFIQFFCTALCITAITNTTIYRYAITVELVDPSTKLLHKKWFLALIMLTLQFIWPLIGCLFCLKIDIRDERAIEENSAVSKVIIDRSRQHACFIASRDIITSLQIIKPIVPFMANIFVCSVMSMVIVVLCLRMITQAQKGTISTRTIRMEKQLMTSLGIQTFVPNIYFLICSVVLIASFFTGGSLGTLIFRMGSLHTLSNFLIMCYTIPAFYKGLSRDFQRYVLRRNIIPGVTNVHVILVSTSHKSPSLPFRSVLKATRHSTHPANSWERTTTNSRI